MLSTNLSNKKLLALLLALSPSPALAQNQTRNGAVLGGVTGAVIGGIVGKQNDETTGGALIGGAVGAVAGGLIGNQRQQQEQQAAQQRYAQQQAQQRYYEQQRAQQRHQHQHNQNGYIVQQQPVYVQTQPVPQTVYIESQPSQIVTTPDQTQQSAPMRRGVTVADIMTLAKNGVSENVIKNHVDSTGVAYQMTVEDVVSMSEAGVSDGIIEAMQNAPIVGGNVNPIPRAIPNSKTLSPASPTTASPTASKEIRPQVSTQQVTTKRLTNTPTPAKRPVASAPQQEPLLLKAVPLPSRKF